MITKKNLLVLYEVYKDIKECFGDYLYFNYIDVWFDYDKKEDLVVITLHTDLTKITYDEFFDRCYGLYNKHWYDIHWLRICVDIRGKLYDICGCAETSD